MMQKLINQLKRHEGVRHAMYLDSEGIPTIGVGHNLNMPISMRAIEVILQDDLKTTMDALYARLPWLDNLSPERQAVLINMAFNLGVEGLLRFKRMIEALKQDDFAAASREMLDSKWARQVGKRATELALQMRTGVMV